MRSVIAVYGVFYLLLGLWQGLAPAHFAAQPFALFPPVSDHYVRDVSSWYLATGVVLLLLARAPDPSRHRLVLLLVVLQAVLHALNHLYDSTLGQGPSWHLFTDTLPLGLATALLAWLVFARGKTWQSA